jgi:hypothetical protein
MGLILVPAGCAVGAPSSSPASGSFDEAAAASYCTEQGGTVVDRVATFNTNSDQVNWIELAGRLNLCEFESTAAGSSPTRISVDLRTLYSTEPTLAGVAYLSKLPPTLPEQPSANPASYNCTYGLAGTSLYGTSAAGGGWTDAAQPVFTVMSLCVFADMSAIDEFGIFYYSQDTVRGADLAEKMRYQPTDGLPAFFDAPGLR